MFVTNPGGTFAVVNRSLGAGEQPPKGSLLAPAPETGPYSTVAAAGWSPVGPFGDRCCDSREENCDGGHSLTDGTYAGIQDTTGFLSGPARRSCVD